MKKVDLILSREIGKRITLGKIEVPCPVCKDDPARKGQLLSSYGDHEELLFCPGCDLEILLKVKIEMEIIK